MKKARKSDPIGSGFRFALHITITPSKGVQTEKDNNNNKKLPNNAPKSM